MLAEQKHFSVNWVNGMKVSSQHFVELENWMHDRYKDLIATQLNDYNYGLLEPVHPEKNSLDLDLSIDQSGLLHMKLMECRAVTRGGHRIEVTSSMIQQENLSINQLSRDFSLENFPNQQFDVIITVNPFNRIPTGQADPQESPFRPPFVIPEYKLDIIPSDQVKTSQFWLNHLIIGKFQVISGEVHFFAEYIPPSTRLNSHYLLIKRYREFSVLLDHLGKNCILILRKLKYNEQKSRLEFNLIQLFTAMANYIAASADHFEYNLLNQSPLQLVIYFKSLFRIFKNDLQKLTDFERDEMMQYFSRWTSSSELDDQVTLILGLKYDHVNCNEALHLVHQIMEKINMLTEKLSGSSADRIPGTPPPPQDEPVKQKPKINIIRNDRRF